MIVASTKIHSVGSVVHGIVNMNSYENNPDQPFIILGHATEQDFIDYWKSTYSNEYEYNPRWKETTFGRQVVAYYKVSTD